MPLRARSGGHSYEGLSVIDDGLVIDVSRLAAVTVDATRGEAVVGAGVKLLDLYQRLWEYGVTVPGGTCPTVGIAGLTLGGGIGFLSRPYGLTCDSLVEVEMVDANGDLLRASESEHPDLFWALRGGGGGNFGIATAFTFRVQPIQNVALCSLSWPWDDAAEVLDAWQRWAPNADKRLTASLAIGTPSTGSISSFGVFTGTLAELQGLIAPLLSVGTPSPPHIRGATWLEAAEQMAGQPSAPGAVKFKNASAYVSEPLSAGAISTFLDQMRAAPSTGGVVGFIPLRGAVADVAPAATAYAHRRALFDMQYQAYWQNAADAQPAIAWVNGLRQTMQPSTDGAYVNYIDLDLPDWQTAYYGANLPRLEQVKAAYDPDNLFNGPQAIPAAAPADRA